MMKNTAIESSAFASSNSAAAAQPAKASSLKPKTPRSRKVTAKADAPVQEVAPSAEAQLESNTGTAKPKTPRAKSTAVTHRHKKLATAPVAEVEIRVESSPAPLAVEPTLAPKAVVEPTNEQIAQLAYSYYVARGYRDGNQAEDWFRAVTELRAQLNP